jgi:phage tail-like protein
MTQFIVNTTRLDPYKSYQFQLKFDGSYVAGLSKISPLKRSSDVVKHRSGGDPSTSHKTPGRTTYEAITLERGLTEDLTFHDWAGAALGSEESPANYRKDLDLEIYNEAGQLEEAYTIYRCWVSEYQATPDLEAGANAIAIAHIKIENDGCELDVGEQTPPPAL